MYIRTYIHGCIRVCMHVHTCICVMCVCILYVYISVFIYINVCWFLFKYACMLVYVYTCIRIYADVHVCLCVYIVECIRVCICMHVWVLSMYLCLYVCVGYMLQRFGFVGEIRTVAGDPDPVRIRARCGPDTMVFQRPIHGTIRRSVLVRVVKTRWRFGSETTSFHVSVRSCAFSYLRFRYAFTCYTYHFM